MRKLALVAMIFIFASFTNASAPSSGKIFIDNFDGSKLVSLSQEVDGMIYQIFLMYDSNHPTDVEMQVVNVTKDKLECEKLEAEIRKLKGKIL
jgi:hypothetical protein